MDPFIAKAWRLLEATHFYEDLGLQQVIFEGDSSQVVNTFLAIEEAYGFFSCITFEIIFLFVDLGWQIHHVKK